MHTLGPAKWCLLQTTIVFGNWQLLQPRLDHLDRKAESFHERQNDSNSLTLIAKSISISFSDSVLVAWAMLRMLYSYIF